MAPDGQPQGRRRGWITVAVVVVLFVVAVVAALIVRVPGLAEMSETLPAMRPTVAPSVVHSVSIDFGVVTDPDTDWNAIEQRLDAVGATTVNLNAGRVEFTAFDWDAHPSVAAEPGTDHLAVAAAALHLDGQGRQRQVNLIVDVFVPEWLKSDPAIAGVSATGRRARYAASASQLAQGEVGQRIIDYVVALGERYDPNQIELTELFLDTYSFGPDDLALFRTMTGRKDWPRTSTGAIDTRATIVGKWRSEVIAGFMARARKALVAVRGGDGRNIGLALDVRVNWNDPAGGRPFSGHDYHLLLAAGIDLQAWIYIGTANKQPADIRRLTAALAAGGYDLPRFTMSVGLWKGPANADPPGRISPDELGLAVAAAQTNGIADVNVTPFSLFTDAHWTALENAWR